MMAEIEAHWVAHHNWALAGEEEGADPKEKPMWKVLHSHPELVVLFLHGPTVEEGLGPHSKICMLVHKQVISCWAAWQNALG